MKNCYARAKNCPLFKGIDEKEFGPMLRCLNAKEKPYRKGEVILLAGDPCVTVGLVLKGAAQVVKEDAQGRQVLLAELSESDLFGEVFACAGTLKSPVTVLASEYCTVLHIDYRRVITACSAACSFHVGLIENMLALLAQKNLMLQGKISILSKRTIRERLLTYFDLVRGDERSFTLSLTREGLAALLCVDRSALSAELSKMQKDGLLTYDKNHFTLK